MGFGKSFKKAVSRVSNAAATTGAQIGIDKDITKGAVNAITNPIALIGGSGLGTDPISGAAIVGATTGAIDQHNQNLGLLLEAPPVAADVAADNEDVNAAAAKEKARLLAGGRQGTLAAGLKYGFSGKNRYKNLLGE